MKLEIIFLIFLFLLRLAQVVFVAIFERIFECLAKKTHKKTLFSPDKWENFLEPFHKWIFVLINQHNEPNCITVILIVERSEEICELLFCWLMS